MKAFAPLTLTFSGVSATPFARFWYTTAIMIPNAYDSRIGSFSTSTMSNVTSVTSGVAHAAALSVQWQAKDLSIFPQDYAVSLAKVIGVSFTPTAAPTSSSKPIPGSSVGLPQQTNPPASDLSTGAKAGVGIGAGLGFLLILSIGLAVLTMRRRRRNETNGDVPARPELEDQDEANRETKWVVGGKWRSEAGIERKIGELDSRPVYVVPGPPVELDVADKRRGSG